MKIDSTFNHFFKALDLELSTKKDIEKNASYYKEIIIDNEKFYTNKYAGDAMTFLQEITGINAPVKDTGIYMSPFVDINVVKRWKKWYAQNKRVIVWCEELKKPCVK